VKNIRSFCVLCIILTLISCIKQKENAQTSLDKTALPNWTAQQSGTNDTISENDNINAPSISIILDAEDTRGVTDITEFFMEYLKDKSDEYLSRVDLIVFHQDNSSEDKLENLGSMKMFPNLKYLRVSSNLTSVDINGLPESLETLVLANNKLTSFNVAALPPKLGILIISKNNLSGFSVAQSTENLFRLDLSFNNLDYINLDFLPQQFQYLNLSYNNIYLLHTSSLPENLRSMDLRYNPIQRLLLSDIDIRVNSERYTPINIPREDVDIREIFRKHIEGFNYSGDEEEKFLDELIERFMLEIGPHEFLYGSYNTLELLNRIADFFGT